MNRTINMSQDQILQWEKYVGKPVEVPQGLIIYWQSKAGRKNPLRRYKESSVGSFCSFNICSGVKSRISGQIPTIAPYFDD